MRDYRLSGKADSDLFEIARYTLETWDEAQAVRYLAGLHELFQMLAKKPQLGTASDDIRPGYLRRR